MPSLLHLTRIMVTAVWQQSFGEPWLGFEQRLRTLGTGSRTEWSSVPDDNLPTVTMPGASTETRRPRQVLLKCLQGLTYAVRLFEYVEILHCVSAMKNSCRQPVP